MKKNQRKIWEKTIHKLLGDDNPCKICLVQVTCDKSFTQKNRSACEELAKRLDVALERIRNESKS